MFTSSQDIVEPCDNYVSLMPHNNVHNFNQKQQIA